MAEYNHFEIERMMESMVVLVDTREQDTPALRRRLKAIQYPCERCKLDYGDYSCRFVNPVGEPISAAGKICIERKMNLDELCACFTRSRARFEREFIRAREDGAKVYLLVENANWEKALSGAYRSRMNPAALTASLLAWSGRYNLVPVFCRSETSGELIGRILRYELKTILERGEL